MSERLRVVVAGGGVGAAETLLALQALAADRVRVTLVAPAEELDVRALSPLSSLTLRPPRRVPLRALVRHAEAILRPGTLQRIVSDERRVLLSDGGNLSYDVLVVAVGARRRRAFDHGVITYGLEHEGDDLPAALADAEAGFVRSLAFVVPPGTSWTLPLHELALLSARRLRERGLGETTITVVTPEHTPLELFGAGASDSVGTALELAGVAVRCDVHAAVPEPGVVDAGGDTVRADRIVALPMLEGPALRGLPADRDGFLPIDDAGRVRGVEGVFAVGDATTYPIKQGGLACQLADVVAAHIAARAGADVEAGTFAPVLRGRLLTGEGELPLGRRSAGTVTPGLWSPARKVEGRFLSDYLQTTGVLPPTTARVTIDVSLPAPSAAAPLSLDPYAPTTIPPR